VTIATERTVSFISKQSVSDLGSNLIVFWFMPMVLFKVKHLMS